MNYPKHHPNYEHDYEDPPSLAGRWVKEQQQIDAHEFEAYQDEMWEAANDPDNQN